MATGGAWQSETFDNGRDYQKPAQEAPGSTPPPPMYNTPSSTRAVDRGVFGALALSLRIAQIVLTLVAFSIMAANKQTTYDYLYSYSIKFSSVEAFVAVLAMNCIVCIYAIVQLVHSIVNMASKGSFVSSATTGFALITFFFDLVLASALIAAAAAGADSVVILTDLDTGASFNKFMQKARASVAMSFLAFAVLAASAALYPIRLRKLARS